MPPRRSRPLALAILLAASTTSVGSAQILDRNGAYPTAAVPQLSPLEIAVLEALAADPATAPYPIVTEIRGGRLVLRGVVGTKRVHDIVMRTAMAFTPSIDDQLVIDTAATTLAVPGLAGPALPPGAGMPGPAGMNRPGLGGAGMGRPLPVPGPAWGVTAQAFGGVPYVYPQPLFGYWDEPFWGMEPPPITYPPWWPALSARRQAETATLAGLPGAAARAPGMGGGAAPLAAVAQANRDTPLPPNTIEMTLDGQGVAILRGSVSTLEERIGLGQKVAETPGIVEVINLIDVRGPDPASAPEDDVRAPAAPPFAFPAATNGPPPLLARPPDGPPVPQPPPAPAPAPPPDRVPPPPAQVPGGSTPALAPIGSQAGGLAARVERAVDRDTGSDAGSVRVEARDGVVTLGGRLPSAFEAMRAFRAAQQTTGVREVVDRLEFPVPRTGEPNPLLERGEPEDIELYLEAQLRRQLGDAARVDRVRLEGDRLIIRGTLAREDDRIRVEAVLRSIPLLRGFRVEPSFRAE